MIGKAWETFFLLCLATVFLLLCVAFGKAMLLIGAAVLAVSALIGGFLLWDAVTDGGTVKPGEGADRHASRPGIVDESKIYRVGTDQPQETK